MGTSLGTNLTQQNATNDSTELWSLSKESQGSVLKNKATGFVMDDRGFSKQQGATIIRYRSNNGTNQDWTIQYR